MAHKKHGVGGVPDPDFKPDPNYILVWDEAKKVYRKVKKDADGKKVLAS